MNLTTKRKIIHSIGLSLPRNIRIVILLLQINIICLAQEDVKIKLFGETDSNDLPANSFYVSGKIIILSLGILWKKYKLQ